MGTMVTAPQQGASDVSYVPLGSKQHVNLSIKVVRQYLCTPTANGVAPSDADVVKFIKLCQARELDPWVGDAFLVGYDSKNGPVFNLITAQQALLKRAEINADYDGMESGVILLIDGKTEYREGDFYCEGEKLLGGWARVHRKNVSRPSFDALKLSTYDSGYSRWKADPAGMIVKCAESSALRKAFPTQLGGLYTREEMDIVSAERIAGRGPVDQTKRITSLDALAEHMAAGSTAPALTAPETKRAAIVEPKPANPYAADFAACKTVAEVLAQHAEMTKEGHPDEAEIDQAMRDRKAQIGGGK